MTQTPEEPFNLAKEIAAMTDEQKSRFLDSLVGDADFSSGVPLEQLLAELEAEHGPFESIATDDFDWLDERPDDDLTDDEFYGRHGWSRDVPTCSDPECPCTGDEDYEAGDQ